MTDVSLSPVAVPASGQKGTAMLRGAAYDRCSHFRPPELPVPDRIRWDAPNMSAVTLIYLLIRSKEVGLFFIANVRVRFLD
jgi:hypothetical protein